MTEEGTAHAAPVPRRAFTLVELLVVIAVVAILIGVLLPALAGARRKAEMIASLNNARQITTAAHAYAFDHEDTWPVIPLREPAQGEDGPVLFNSWNWGGKTSHDFWKENYSGINHVPVEDRVLNPYVYPDITLEDPPEIPGRDNRLELPIFEAPGDTESHQRDFWGEEARPVPISSYDDCGTSYHLNMKWWFQDPARPGENDAQKWARLRTLFRRGAYATPARFVWLHDQTIDLVAIRAIDREGNHSGKNRSIAAFMDGHAEYLRAEPGRFTTPDYTLIFE